ARNYFRTVRTVAIPKILFRVFWLKGTLSGSRILAYRAAVVLRAHGHRRHARFLTLANRIIRAIPFARPALNSLISFSFICEIENMLMPVGSLKTMPVKVSMLYRILNWKGSENSTWALKSLGRHIPPWRHIIRRKD